MKAYTNKKNRILQTFQIVLAVTFCTTSICNGLVDTQLPSPKHVAQVIPSVAGRIMNVHRAGDKEVVIIKDDHCNPEAQKNVTRILETVARLNGGKVMVAVEGAQGEVNVDFIGTFPLSEIRRKVVLKLVDKGLVTGAEYFAIKNYGLMRVEVFGVENADLYTEDFRLFRKTLNDNVHVREFFRLLEVDLQRLGDEIYKKEITELNILNKEYFEKRLSLDEYSLKLAEKLGGDVKGENLNWLLESAVMEQGIDYDAVDAQTVSLLQTISEKVSSEEMKLLAEKGVALQLDKISESEYYLLLDEYLETNNDLRKTFPALSLYIESLKIQELIDPNVLREEIIELSNAVRNKSYRTEDEKILDLLKSEVASLKSLLFLDLSRKQFSEILDKENVIQENQIKENLIHLKNVAGIQQLSVLSDDVLWEEISKKKDLAWRFYEIAKERDSVLLENTLKKMSDSNEKLAVLIVGGFHASGIQQALADKGYSYTVIVPVAKQSGENNPYFRLMLGDNYAHADDTDALSLPLFFDRVLEEKLMGARNYDRLTRSLFDNILSEIAKEGISKDEIATLWAENYQNNVPGALLSTNAFFRESASSEFLQLVQSVENELREESYKNIRAIGVAAESEQSKIIPEIVTYNGNTLTLSERIGAGANGIVFKGTLEDSSGDIQTVAIKVPVLASPDGAGIRNLVKEIMQLESLRDSEGIIPFLGAIEVNNIPYLITPFIERESEHQIADRTTLRSWFQQTRSAEDIQKVITSILNGLEAIHAQGKIHFDIKPDNVFVDSDGNAYIADLGSNVPANVELLKQDSSFTLMYAAPEIIDVYLDMDQAALTPRTDYDIYSFGLMLLNLFTDVQLIPSEITYENWDEVKSLLANRSEVNNEVDEAFTTMVTRDPANAVFYNNIAAFIKRCLQKEGRFASGKDALAGFQMNMANIQSVQPVIDLDVNVNALGISEFIGQKDGQPLTDRQEAEMSTPADSYFRLTAEREFPNIQTRMVEKIQDYITFTETNMGEVPAVLEQLLSDIDGVDISQLIEYLQDGVDNFNTFTLGYALEDDQGNITLDGRKFRIGLDAEFISRNLIKGKNIQNDNLRRLKNEELQNIFAEYLLHELLHAYGMTHPESIALQQKVFWKENYAHLQNQLPATANGTTYLVDANTQKILKGRLGKELRAHINLIASNNIDLNDQITTYIARNFPNTIPKHKIRNVMNAIISTGTFNNLNLNTIEDNQIPQYLFNEIVRVVLTKLASQLGVTIENNVDGRGGVFIAHAGSKRGGFATVQNGVYIPAYDPNTPITSPIVCALKKSHENLEQSLKDMFVQEVEFMRSLDEKGISKIPLISTFRDSERNGQWFILMGYVKQEGQEENEIDRFFTKQGEEYGGDSASLQKLLNMTGDILSDLTKIHNAGIVHNDIKPSNIIAGVLVNPDGTLPDQEDLFILDYGIASKDGSNVPTSPGGQPLVAGTPSYLPAEAFEITSYVANKDLFALSQVLLNVLLRKRSADILESDPVYRMNMDQNRAIAMLKYARFNPDRRYQYAKKILKDSLDNFNLTPEEQMSYIVFSTILLLSSNEDNENRPIDAGHLLTIMNMIQQAYENGQITSTNDILENITLATNSYLEEQANLFNSRLNLPPDQQEAITTKKTYIDTWINNNASDVATLEEYLNSQRLLNWEFAKKVCSEVLEIVEPDTIESEVSFPFVRKEIRSDAIGTIAGDHLDVKDKSMMKSLQKEFIETYAKRFPVPFMKLFLDQFKKLKYIDMPFYDTDGKFVTGTANTPALQVIYYLLKAKDENGDYDRARIESALEYIADCMLIGLFNADGTVSDSLSDDDKRLLGNNSLIDFKRAFQQAFTKNYPQLEAHFNPLKQFDADNYEISKDGFTLLEKKTDGRKIIARSTIANEIGKLSTRFSFPKQTNNSTVTLENYYGVQTVVKKAATPAENSVIETEAAFMRDHLQTENDEYQDGVPHLISITESQEDDDNKVSFRAEYFPGEELASFFNNNAEYLLKRPELIMQLLTKISSILTTLQANNILHNDIKPSNILVRWKNGELDVQIIDFGNAKVGETAAIDSGTLGMMSLESLAPIFEANSLTGNASKSSDVFSLAMTMYYIIDTAVRAVLNDSDYPVGVGSEAKTNVQWELYTDPVTSEKKNEWFDFLKKYGDNATMSAILGKKISAWEEYYTREYTGADIAKKKQLITMMKYLLMKAARVQENDRIPSVGALANEILQLSFAFNSSNDADPNLLGTLESKYGTISAEEVEIKKIQPVAAPIVVATRAQALRNPQLQNAPSEIEAVIEERTDRFDNLRELLPVADITTIVTNLSEAGLPDLLRTDSDVLSSLIENILYSIKKSADDDTPLTVDQVGRALVEIGIRLSEIATGDDSRRRVESYLRQNGDFVYDYVVYKDVFSTIQKDIDPQNAHYLDGLTGSSYIVKSVDSEKLMALFVDILTRSNEELLGKFGSHKIAKELVVFGQDDVFSAPIEGATRRMQPTTQLVIDSQGVAGKLDILKNTELIGRESGSILIEDVKTSQKDLNNAFSSEELSFINTGLRKFADMLESYQEQGGEISVEILTALSRNLVAFENNNQSELTIKAIDGDVASGNSYVVALPLSIDVNIIRFLKDIYTTGQTIEDIDVRAAFENTVFERMSSYLYSVLATATNQSSEEINAITSALNPNFNNYIQVYLDITRREIAINQAYTLFQELLIILPLEEVFDIVRKMEDSEYDNDVFLSLLPLDGGVISGWALDRLEQLGFIELEPDSTGDKITWTIPEASLTKLRELIREREIINDLAYGKNIDISMLQEAFSKLRLLDNEQQEEHISTALYDIQSNTSAFIDSGTYSPVINTILARLNDVISQMKENIIVTEAEIVSDDTFLLGLSKTVSIDFLQFITDYARDDEEAENMRYLYLLDVVFNSVMPKYVAEKRLLESLHQLLVVHQEIPEKDIMRYETAQKGFFYDTYLTRLENFRFETLPIHEQELLKITLLLALDDNYNNDLPLAQSEYITVLKEILGREISHEFVGLLENAELPTIPLTGDEQSADYAIKHLMRYVSELSSEYGDEVFDLIKQGLLTLWQMSPIDITDEVLETVNSTIFAGLKSRGLSDSMSRIVTDSLITLTRAYPAQVNKIFNRVRIEQIANNDYFQELLADNSNFYKNFLYYLPDRYHEKFIETWDIVKVTEEQSRRGANSLLRQYFAELDTLLREDTAADLDELKAWLLKNNLAGWDQDNVFSIAQQMPLLASAELSVFERDITEDNLVNKVVLPVDYTFLVLLDRLKPESIALFSTWHSQSTDDILSKQENAIALLQKELDEGEFVSAIPHLDDWAQSLQMFSELFSELGSMLPFSLYSAMTRKISDAQESYTDLQMRREAIGRILQQYLSSTEQTITERQKFLIEYFSVLFASENGISDYLNSYYVAFNKSLSYAVQKLDTSVLVSLVSLTLTQDQDLRQKVKELLEQNDYEDAVAEQIAWYLSFKNYDGREILLDEFEERYAASLSTRSLREIAKITMSNSTNEDKRAQITYELLRDFVDTKLAEIKAGDLDVRPEILSDLQSARTIFLYKQSLNAEQVDRLKLIMNVFGYDINALNTFLYLAPTTAFASEQYNLRMEKITNQILEEAGSKKRLEIYGLLRNFSDNPVNLTADEVRTTAKEIIGILGWKTFKGILEQLDAEGIIDNREIGWLSFNFLLKGKGIWTGFFYDAVRSGVLQKSVNDYVTIDSFQVLEDFAAESFVGNEAELAENLLQEITLQDDEMSENARALQFVTEIGSLREAIDTTTNYNNRKKISVYEIDQDLFDRAKMGDSFVDAKMAQLQEQLELIRSNPDNAYRYPLYTLISYDDLINALPDQDKIVFEQYRKLITTLSDTPYDQLSPSQKVYITASQKMAEILPHGYAKLVTQYTSKNGKLIDVPQFEIAEEIGRAIFAVDGPDNLQANPEILLALEKLYRSLTDRNAKLSSTDIKKLLTRPELIIPPANRRRYQRIRNFMDALERVEKRA